MMTMSMIYSWWSGLNLAPCPALLFVGLVQLLNFVWLRWEFSLWAGVQLPAGPWTTRSCFTARMSDWSSAWIPLCCACCVFWVIFKQMHLLSSVFFLVLIVTQIELKPLFFNTNHEKVQLLCITSELLRCATQRPYFSSSSAPDNFKQLCPWGSSTCCVTQWFGAQCRQGRVVLCLLFWQYAAHVLCQIQSSFIYKQQTNKPIGKKLYMCRTIYRKMNLNAM